MLNRYQTVWLVDFEFAAPPGAVVKVLCLVAIELHSGRVIRLWENDLRKLDLPPYDIGPDSLFIAYYASAELGCHLALGWDFPENVLDLFVEFRQSTNGLPNLQKPNLLVALAFHGLPGISAIEKDSMRELALRGAPYSEEEKLALLDYCQSDVDALVKLLPKMLPNIDLPRAIFRGHYMKAAARMEFAGVPIDVGFLERLKLHWMDIQDELIQKIDQEYGVFEGRTFKSDRFAGWLVRNNIPWPRLDSGNLDLSDDAFKQMARAYPAVSPLRELRASLSQMRLSKLSVGPDGRNRCLLSVFAASTGRNQPSNSRFIFGPSVWLRGLIRPKPGFGVAYIDWSQQEFGIAAALSGDPLMKLAYASGDPYLAFAKQAGAVPEDATKKSHKAEREQFKACVLAVQYGMKPESLAIRIGQPVAQARRLLEMHRETYKVFWKWSEASLDCAMLLGKLWTVYGWEVLVTDKSNARSLANFPMQGNGAEMLRLACCLVTEAGIKVCAPIHDAILIEAPLDELDAAVTLTKQLMSDASAYVLDGFRLNSDAEVIRYPDRYADERGVKMWTLVSEMLETLDP